MKNKAVIFDLDGTLIDSITDIEININIMLKHFGYKKRSVSEIKSFVGSGARNLVIKSIGDNLSEEEIDERLRYYNEKYTSSKSPNTKIFNGVKEVVDTLRERGYKLAILTNKPQTTTDTVIERYFKGLKFDKIVGEKNGVRCKPDKTATINILKEFNVLPEDAFFVGDGETDILTAKNSGVKSIAVLWGNRTKAQLEAVGATVFINNPLELLDLIK